jgi:hypothetical protein
MFKKLCAHALFAPLSRLHLRERWPHLHRFVTRTFQQWSYKILLDRTSWSLDGCCRNPHDSMTTYVSPSRIIAVLTLTKPPSSPNPSPHLQTPLNRLPNLLRLRPRNPLHDIPILEHTKRRHRPHPQLLRNILTFFNIIRVKLDIWLLSHHLSDFRRNDVAVFAPSCCAFEDCDAFVHYGAEILGFGVEGGYLWVV